jgi:hypothetical protein
LGFDHSGHDDNRKNATTTYREPVNKYQQDPDIPAVPEVGIQEIAKKIRYYYCYLIGGNFQPDFSKKPVQSCVFW